MSRIELAARAAHEANRAYCISIGDTSQAHWEDAPAWQRDSAIGGVYNVHNGVVDPQASHQSWLDEKAAAGWVYGEIKDPEAKMHPCIVPYDDLPEAQKLKDSIFVSVVRSMLDVV